MVLRYRHNPRSNRLKFGKHAVVGQIVRHPLEAADLLFLRRRRDHRYKRRAARHREPASSSRETRDAPRKNPPRSQLIEQSLRLLQVYGVEALGEPVDHSPAFGWMVHVYPFTGNNCRSHSEWTCPSRHQLSRCWNAGLVVRIAPC